MRCSHGRQGFKFFIKPKKAKKKMTPKYPIKRHHDIEAMPILL
jgi:hypothetical protein